MNHIERVLPILQHFESTKRLFIAPGIPPKKQNNALRKLGLSSETTLLGLIDLTVFGSAKDCIAFTIDGIHYCGAGVGEKLGPISGTIQYSDLSRLRFGAREAPESLQFENGTGLLMSFGCSAGTVVRVFEALICVTSAHTWKGGESGLHCERCGLPANPDELREWKEAREQEAAEKERAEERHRRNMLQQCKKGIHSYWYDRNQTRRCRWCGIASACTHQGSLVTAGGNTWCKSCGATIENNSIFD